MTCEQLLIQIVNDIDKNIGTKCGEDVAGLARTFVMAYREKASAIDREYDRRVDFEKGRDYPVQAKVYAPGDRAVGIREAVLRFDFDGLDAIITKDDREDLRKEIAALGEGITGGEVTVIFCDEEHYDEF